MVTMLLAVLLQTRTVAHVDVYGRADPAGAAVVAGLFHRWVGSVDEAEQIDASYLQVGGVLTGTPAYVEPGVYVEAAPAPFLILRFEVDGFGFLGIHGGQGLLRFDDASSAFGSSVLASMAGQERDGWATRVAGSIVLRAKWGPWIPRIDFTGAGYVFADPGPYLYESEYDTLLARHDGILGGRAVLLVQAWRAGHDALLVVGPMVEATRTIETSLARTRLGALAYFVPADACGSLLRPHAFATAGVDAVDPNRAGQPYALAGVGAEWQ